MNLLLAMLLAVLPGCVDDPVQAISFSSPPNGFRFDVDGVQARHIGFTTLPPIGHHEGPAAVIDLLVPPYMLFGGNHDGAIHEENQLRMIRLFTTEDFRFVLADFQVCGAYLTTDGSDGSGRRCSMSTGSFWAFKEPVPWFFGMSALWGQQVTLDCRKECKPIDAPHDLAHLSFARDGTKTQVWAPTAQSPEHSNRLPDLFETKRLLVSSTHWLPAHIAYDDDGRSRFLSNGTTLAPGPHGQLEPPIKTDGITWPLPQPGAAAFPVARDGSHPAARVENAWRDVAETASIPDGAFPRQIWRSDARSMTALNGAHTFSRSETYQVVFDWANGPPRAWEVNYDWPLAGDATVTVEEKAAEGEDRSDFVAAETHVFVDHAWGAAEAVTDRPCVNNQVVLTDPEPTNRTALVFLFEPVERPGLMDQVLIASDTGHLMGIDVEPSFYGGPPFPEEVSDW